MVSGLLAGTTPIHIKQLDSMELWLDQFRKRTLKPTEQVDFDVVGGDFNFDNISPGRFFSFYFCVLKRQTWWEIYHTNLFTSVDRQATSHQLFDKYLDVGRTKVGQDQPWTVGT